MLQMMGRKENLVGRGNQNGLKDMRRKTIIHCAELGICKVQEKQCKKDVYVSLCDMGRQWPEGKSLDRELPWTGVKGGESDKPTLGKNPMGSYRRVNPGFGGRQRQGYGAYHLYLF